jgi:Rieske Fe-S protein
MAELEAPSAEETTRRKFLSGLIGVVAGVVSAIVAIPAIGYLISPGLKRGSSENWINLGPVASVAPGLPTPFKWSRQIEDGWVKATQSGTAYAVQLDGQELKVLSDVCTHLGCRVVWNQDRQLFACPCHDAFFAADGQVASGPPPKPLINLPHRIENGQIQIRLEA